MHKPKIVIVGAGSSASFLIDRLSKNNTNDIRYLSLSEEFDNNKFLNNDKVKTINTTKGIKLSLEEARDWCIEFNKIERLEELLMLMQEGDEIYKVHPTNQGCLQRRNWMDIKLKRNGETITSFKLYGDFGK